MCISVHICHKRTTSTSTQTQRYARDGRGTETRQRHQPLPQGASIATRVENPSVRCQPGFSVGSRWWFPLPYNPTWDNTILMEIKRINSDAGLRALLFGAFHIWNNVQISPSWSNSMPNLSQCFERLGWQEEGV